MACDLTIKNLPDYDFEYFKKRYKKLKNKDNINSFDDIELFDVFDYDGESGIKKIYIFNPIKMKNEVIRLEREQKLNKLEI